MEPNWTLSYLGKCLKGIIHGKSDLPVSHLVVDSRTMAASDSVLFVALTGEQHNGHDYIPELYKRGVRAFLVSEHQAYEEFPEAGFCQVNNTLAGLQALAASWRTEYKGKVVAITGSNGKTIVKEWIYQCLSEKFHVHRSPKSYNSQVGVPLSVWMMGKEHDLALIEAGISHPGEMDRLQAVIKPNVGVFTHLGSAHQENFGSLEEKILEKLRLFRGCSKVFCRADVTLGEKPLLFYMRALPAEIVDWSLAGEAKYRYHVLSRTALQTTITIKIQGRSLEFTLPFSDEASIENALHALTFSMESGLEADRAVKRIEHLEPVSMRLEMLQGIQGSVLINDAYNSDIGGLIAALDLVEQQDKPNGKMVILSDLLQSGIEEAALYEEIAGLLRQKAIKFFVGIGPAIMQHRSLFEENSLFYKDTDSYLKGMDRTLFADRVILIKGSRKFGFERITNELQLKTHQTRLEIDLNAMVHNLNYYKSLLQKKVKTMVMVKALSYGSGNVEVANLLQFHKVDYLAVAFIDEGIELRRAGVHLPILVLNPDPSGYGPMIDFQLEPEIFSMTGIQALFDLTHYRGIRNYPIHLKMDTGMHRLGFLDSDLEALIPWLIHTEFRIASVFSHLAASPEPGHDGFTLEQIARFKKMAAKIQEGTGKKFDLHLLNSAGIERFPQAQFDMVRLGIGLHGIGLAKQLKPVSSFKTTISQIRTLSRGESVGYSRKGVVERESDIATIPVGYADGLDRRFGNGIGSVWINGHMAPIVGDICMDMTMVDVSGLGASEGDEVELFGKHQTVADMALRTGTIPYEILTSIPDRVKRVYLQE